MWSSSVKSILKSLDFTTIIVIVLSIRVWGDEIHTQSKGWGWGSLELRVNDDFYNTPQWGVIAIG
jgi:hypothetical protein